jgi:hypothetical protein
MWTMTWGLWCWIPFIYLISCTMQLRIFIQIVDLRIKNNFLDENKLQNSDKGWFPEIHPNVWNEWIEPMITVQIDLTCDLSRHPSYSSDVHCYLLTLFLLSVAIWQPALKYLSQLGKLYVMCFSWCYWIFVWKTFSVPK